MGIMIGENTFLNDNPKLTARIPYGNDPYRIVLLPNLDEIINKKKEAVSLLNLFKLSKEDGKTIIVTDKEIEKNLTVEKLKEEYRIKFIFMNGKQYKLKDILKKIGELKIDSVLIEGGSSLISCAFAENIIDEGEIFIAPKILGDPEAVPFINGFTPLTIKDGFHLQNVEINTYEDNVSFRFKK
jgi:diaminohydroxyphosphoribosylaminopyrimidine deaminase/5-amino-6-(5-phosphoribosylamino)uracil reductase